MKSLNNAKAVHTILVFFFTLLVLCFFLESYFIDNPPSDGKMSKAKWTFENKNIDTKPKSGFGVIQIYIPMHASPHLNFVLQNLESDPMIHNGAFKIQLIVEDKALLITNMDVIRVHCKLNEESLCHSIAGYSAFMKSSYSWLYRAPSSAALNLENLKVYISRLNSVYNPTKEAVIKGHITKSHKIAPEPGWLMSRRYIELRLNSTGNNSTDLEEDTSKSETIFASKLIGSKDAIDDNHIVEYQCSNCFSQDIFSSHWERLAFCPSESILGVAADIVAISASESDDKNNQFVAIWKKLPPQVLFYSDEPSQQFSLCYREHPRGVRGYTIGELHGNKISVTELK